MLGAYQDSIVFDICCGTGTIGLSLASRAKEVSLWHYRDGFASFLGSLHPSLLYR